MFNLSIALEDKAHRIPNQTAIIFEDENISYNQFNELSNKVANLILDLGIKRGDSIALQAPNNSFFPIIYYGILKMGGVVVTLSILLKKKEISYILKDSKAKLYFFYQGDQTFDIAKEAIEGAKESSELIDCVIIENQQNTNISDISLKKLSSLMSNTSNKFEYALTNAEETAVIIYTSGTTGKPKGAKLTHSNLAWNSSVTVDLFNFNKDDVALTVLPLFHIFGQNCIMNAAIFAGIANVLLERFEADTIVQLIQKHRVSIFAGVPTMFWSLLNETSAMTKKEISLLKKHWRIALSGGAAIPIELLNDFEKTYGVKIFEGYGMSEASPLVTYNQPAFERKIGSVGLPIWGVQVKIVNNQSIEVPNYEVGQIIFRGHNVMKGYFNNKEATKKSIKKGWMHSGDLGYIDDDGYLFVVDRMNDMIIRGGANVYPREIEEVIIKHPKVSLVAVVGIPDKRMGEEIKAYVILNQDQKISKSEFKNWIKTKVAANKYPRQIEFVNELPLNATGKILKRKLKFKEH
tara:strand:+ start:6437 stop:7996 length:1560 start_codon:yes stop_codon:yes gene_type:complete